MYDHAYGNVETIFPSSGPATPVLQTPVNCEETTDLTPTLDWSDYGALDGSTQAAFELQVSDNDPFFGGIVRKNVKFVTATLRAAARGTAFNVS